MLAKTTRMGGIFIGTRGFLVLTIFWERKWRILSYLISRVHISKRFDFITQDPVSNTQSHCAASSHWPSTRKRNASSMACNLLVHDTDDHVTPQFAHKCCYGNVLQHFQFLHSTSRCLPERLHDRKLKNIYNNETVHCTRSEHSSLVFDIQVMSIATSRLDMLDVWKDIYIYFFNCA